MSEPNVAGTDEKLSPEPRSTRSGATSQQFRVAQASLREEVFAATSEDGRLELEVNAEGLALRVAIAPDLLAERPAAVERAVMEAINNAAIQIQMRATETLQACAQEYLRAAGIDRRPIASDEASQR